MVQRRRDRLRTVLQGSDPQVLWNANIDPAFRVRTVGDVVRRGAERVGKGIILSEKDAMGVWSMHADPRHGTRTEGDIARREEGWMEEMKPVAQKMIGGLLDLASTGGKEDLLRTIFDNDASFTRHVQKRMARGEITSAMDYAEKTFSVLANAKYMTIAEPKNVKMLPTGKIQLTTGSWIVLLGEHGNVVTSYPFIAGVVQFEQRHREIGDEVYEQRISDTYREALKRVFGSR